MIACQTKLLPQKALVVSNLVKSMSTKYSFSSQFLILYDIADPVIVLTSKRI